MLTEKEYFLQSLVTNLYYIRTLRGYVARIGLSLPSIYQEYFNRGREIAKRAEDINKRLEPYQNNSLPKDVIESGIIVTPYTLQLELLTERLFKIDVDTAITEKQLNLIPGDITPTEQQVTDMEKINNDAYTLANDFIKFAKEMHSIIENQDIFAFYYNTINLYIMEDANLYISSLERLRERATVNPSYVIDNQYFGTLSMQTIATLIRGEIDPIHKDVFDEANNFVIEYQNILTKYENMVITPENQKNMTLDSLEVAERFKRFVEQCIERLLSKEISFISPPLTKDNELTSVNFFIFNLKQVVLVSLNSI